MTGGEWGKSGPRRLGSPRTGNFAMKMIRMMYSRIWTGRLASLLLVGGLAVGCHKQPAAAGPVTTSDTNGPATTFAAERAKPVPPNADILQDPTVRLNLRQLTGLLNQFLAVNHRIPVSFAELSASFGGSVPPPPAGYRYVVRGPSVTLQANQ